MDKRTINIADVELQPRPPQFAATGPDGKPGGFRHIGRPEMQVPYWEGEGNLVSEP